MSGLAHPICGHHRKDGPSPGRAWASPHRIMRRWPGDRPDPGSSHPSDHWAPAHLTAPFIRDPALPRCCHARIEKPSPGPSLLRTHICVCRPKPDMVKAVIVHSWSHNIGDAAMLQTITCMLHSISSDISISALVSHPADSRAHLPDLKAELAPWPWPVPGSGDGPPTHPLAYPLIFASNLFSALVYRAIGRRVFLLNGRFSGPLSRLFDCDVVISPGGDFIGPRYFFMTAFGEFLIAKMLGKRLVVLAQSIGPFEGGLHPSIAHLFLGMPDRICLRDEESARRLRSLGIKDVRLTADLAFAFPVPSPGGRKRDGRGGVALCAKRVQGDDGAYRRWMLELIGRIFEDTGEPVLLLPTDRHDLPLQRALAQASIGKSILMEGVPSPHEMVRVLSTKDFLISSRMHAIILGSISSTPFFAISDSFKFRGVLDRLCSGCVRDIGSLDGAAMQEALDLMRRREELGSRIRSAFPAMRADAMANRDVLRQDMRSWGFIGDDDG